MTYDPAVEAARRASITVKRWLPGDLEPLDTRPPELWVDLVHDECGGDW